MDDAMVGTKVARQAAILEIINSEPVTSQENLRNALLERGFETVQATLSRDLAEMRAIKVKTTSGLTAYSIPDELGRHVSGPDRTNARLARWCQDLLVSAQTAQNMVVIRTPAGAANLLGSAIDTAHIRNIAGTIAGDDTILLVCPTVDDAEEIRALLIGLAESDTK